MFTAIVEDAPRNRQNLPSGIQTKGYKPGSEYRKKAKSRVRKSNNGFLTVVFKPLPIEDFNPLFSEDNYKHLYESVLVYARLLGYDKPLEYNPMDFEAPHTYLQELLPGNQECRIMAEDDNRLRLWIFDTEHEDHTLYYLPCSLITRSEGIFRDILIAFFSHFQQKQRLTPQEESMYFEYIREEFYNTDEADLDEDWVELVKRYFEGDIGEVLESIDRKPKYSLRKLRQLLSEFIPANMREQQLKKLIGEGLKFLSKKGSIRTYAVPPDIDENYAWPVEIDNVIQIIYDSDAVCESQIQFYNECAQESGFEFICAGWMEITPETQSLLTANKYVRVFMDWLNRLNDELYYA